MATLSLKVSVAGSTAIKTMQFDPSTIVYDACRIIREKFPGEANEGNRTYMPVKIYGLLNTSFKMIRFH